MTTAALVTLDHVDVSYRGGRPVLSDVTLDITPSHFVGVVGPSGAGKTTLLRAILGTVRPSHGTVRREPGLTMAYVPQLETVNWDFPVTVFQCVLMARTRGRLPWPSRAERCLIGELLERLDIGHLAQRHIRELSGGQQQRMFIARALLQQPQLLLLDEPTSGVDVATRHDVLHLLADLHRSGIAVVLTTHDLNGIAAHLPLLVCVNHRLLAAGPPRKVITPEVLEQTFGARMEVLEHLGMPLIVAERTVGPVCSGAAS